MLDSLYKLSMYFLMLCSTREIFAGRDWCQLYRIIELNTNITTFKQ